MCQWVIPVDTAGSGEGTNLSVPFFSSVLVMALAQRKQKHLHSLASERIICK